MRGTQISLDSLMITKQILLRWFFWIILLGFELLGEAGPRSTQKHTTHLFVKFRDFLPRKKSCPEKLEIWSTNSNVNVEMHFVWNKSLTFLKEQFTQKWKLSSFSHAHVVLNPFNLPSWKAQTPCKQIVVESNIFESWNEGKFEKPVWKIHSQIKLIQLNSVALICWGSQVNSLLERKIITLK